MRLSPPKIVSWSVAVLFGFIGILLHQGLIPVDIYPDLDFWMMTGAFLILAFATLLKGI
jgi:hypothetical protein